MTSPTGGRWLFSPDPISGLNGAILGINDGTRPVFPLPVTGKLNIEVFTNATVSGLPNPETGFQQSMTDPSGTIDNGFLTGTNLRLGGGDFLAVDSVTGSALQGGSKMTLGSGNQTVVGAKFDTLVGGSGNQILSALLGNETVVGGSGNESIWGGANDSIVAGTGTNQIVVTGKNTTVVAGLSGSAVVALSANNTVTSLSGSTQNIGIASGGNDLIDLTGNSGTATFVLGANGDTITGGGGSTAILGSAGGMLIKVGAGGTTAVSGSTNTVAGNTVTGGAGGLNFNPGPTAGKGDRIDLSGSNGTATINSFSFQNNNVNSPDTVFATNNSDQVFGGAGDRIGTSTGTVVGGTHQWTHGDSVSGSVGFGSNDSVSSTTYDTVSATKTATRGNAAGTSSAQVTIGGFNTANDFIFYQTETQATTNAIIATAQATSINVAGNATPSSIITLPDGTVMTIIGVTVGQLSPTLFK